MKVYTLMYSDLDTGLHLIFVSEGYDLALKEGNQEAFAYSLDYNDESWPDNYVLYEWDTTTQEKMLVKTWTKLGDIDSNHRFDPHTDVVEQEDESAFFGMEDEP